MSDYIYPKFVTDILKRPSIRTQMESSLVGITFMMLGSLAMVTYLLITGETSWWFKVFLIASEIGILSFQFSLISTTYQTYHSYKLESGLYPIPYELQLKIEEANKIQQDLNILLTKLKENKKEEIKKC